MQSISVLLGFYLSYNSNLNKYILSWSWKYHFCRKLHSRYYCKHKSLEIWLQQYILGIMLHNRWIYTICNRKIANGKLYNEYIQLATAVNAAVNHIASQVVTFKRFYFCEYSNRVHILERFSILVGWKLNWFCAFQMN